MTFQYNEFGACLNCEQIVLFQNGSRSYVIVKLASHDNKWSFGWDVEDLSGSASGSNVGLSDFLNPERVFDTRDQALDAAKYYILNSVLPRFPDTNWPNHFYQSLTQQTLF